MTAQTAPAAPEFDLGALERYLRETFTDLSGPMQVERIAGGQSNPTFFVTFGETRLVLRKQPPGKLLPSAHAIDREYRVMSALADANVPVPQTLLFCDDRHVVGTPFYIMRRVDGRVFHDCQLEAASAADRPAMYRSSAISLARLHKVNPDSIGLSDFGKRENYFARQVERWSKQWELSRQRDDRNIDNLIEWLPRNIPESNLTTIAHGDYRIGNLMFHPTRCEVVAILDWELSTLGHPLADLAHFCMTWHTRPEEYGGVRGLDLKALQLPGQKEFEDWYYAEAGHGLQLKPFHMAFALFRFAVIFEGIAARARAGNAADPNAARVGQLSIVLAERAIELLDKDRV